LGWHKGIETRLFDFPDCFNKVPTALFFFFLFTFRPRESNHRDNIKFLNKLCSKLRAMKDFFEELFSYNYYFNQKLAALFSSAATKIPEQSLLWFNHILNAHEIWNSRILQLPTAVKGWDLRDTGELGMIDRRNYDQSRKILEQVDLGSSLSYKNARGESFSNKAGDILFHVVNHSTYHRGQIAFDLRQHGIEPVVSDFIFYKR
jgi:uncharacterized damage-inducible protein DinB